MVDILSIKPVVLRTLVVKHPKTGQPLGLEIDFRSMDSDEAQAAERIIKNKSLRSGRNAPTVEKLEEGEYAIMHAVTAAWRWADGLTLGPLKNPPLTRENTEKLYRAAPWIKKQLDEEIRDEAAFFQTEPNSSPDT